MKYITTLITSLLFVTIFMSAAPAQAFFEDHHLVLVVYHEDDVEVAIDLGDLGSIDFPGQDVLLAPAGSVSLSRFQAVGTWSELRAGCFGSGDNHNIWFGYAEDTEPIVSSASLLSFESAASGVQSLYGETDASVSITPAANSRSYDVKMNSNSNAPGYYSGYNTLSEKGEVALEDLDTEGYKDIYVYRFEIDTLVENGNLPYQGVLRIMDDGSVVLNPSDGGQSSDNTGDSGGDGGGGGGCFIKTATSYFYK